MHVLRLDTIPATFVSFQLQDGIHVYRRLFSSGKPTERTGQMVGSTPQPGAGNSLRVSRAEDAVLIQVHGQGNMLLAPTLQTFVESELRAGFRCFVVDLRDCSGMDSTFMGTFIGLTVQVKNADGWFCLVHVSDENMRLLTMLGVLNMVSVHDGEFPAADGESAVLHPTKDPYARQKQILAAHKELTRIDPGNKERFQSFIDALEAEMRDVPTILPPGKKDGEK